MKKWFVLLLVLGALAYGGFHLRKTWQQKQYQAAMARQPKTVKVESRDIRFTVSAAGDIGPADQVSVRPEVNGRIAELPVDIGDSVKHGELLCRLDDADLQIERSSRLVEIEGAKLQLEKAQRNFERAKKLVGDKLIAKEVFDDTQTDFNLAKNNLERSDQALKLVEDRISKTKIMAPFDCTILTRPVSIGQAVSGSGGFNSGTEVMTVANLNEMVILAHISQADVTHLQANQPVDVEIESVPGLKMKGAIERIAPQATVKNNLKGFSARIVLKKIDPRVRPGMTANLSIPVDTAEGVLAIPLGAIFSETDGRFVFVQKSNSFEHRPVQLGISDYNFAEVTQGVSAEDLVALEQPAEFTEADGTVAQKGGKGKGHGRRGGGNTNAPAGAASNPRRTPSL